MADTKRLLADILALFPDNASANISEQDLRDFVVSVMPPGRGATQVVASNDASDLIKSQADYVCDGTADDVQIQAALDALPSGGGRVLLTAGVFTIAASITLASYDSLEGQGTYATILRTTTSSIDVIQAHGADISNKLQGIRVANMLIDSDASATSDGLSIQYCKRSIFENLDITDFNGHGLHIQGSHDNRYTNIFVGNCGHTASTLAAVYLENEADQSVNNEHFTNLFIETFRYRGLSLGTDSGTYITHLNRFVSTKIYGDGTVVGLVVDGDWNIFTNTEIENVGTTDTGVQIGSTGINNIFNSTIFGNTVGLCFDINGDHNIISGVTGDGGATKLIDDGIDIAGDENIISNVSFINLHGWSFSLSGDNNQLIGVILESIDEVITNIGAGNRFIGVQGAGASIANLVADPGDGVAISVTLSGEVPLVTAGAETRTLAAPSFIGQELTLYMKTDNGDCVVTVATTINETGNTVITFANTGEYIFLRAVEEGSNLRWRVVAFEGVILSGGLGPGSVVRVLDRDLSTDEVVSSTDEESIYSFSVPAGLLGSVGGLHLVIGGDSLKNVAGTIVLKVKLGSTALLTTTALSFSGTANRYKWLLDVYIINSAAGAQKCVGKFQATQAAETFPLVHTSGAAAIQATGKGTASEDTTGALTLDVTVQWSASNASLSFRKELAVLTTT